MERQFKNASFHNTGAKWETDLLILKSWLGAPWFSHGLWLVLDPHSLLDAWVSLYTRQEQDLVIIFLVGFTNW